MSAIPFGFVGAVLGHLLLGLPLSMMSVFGIVALSGVVVNASLVLVDFVNRRRAEGASAVEAVLDAARARFRPVVLTSLTTFVGLIPIMLEGSPQAQFIIPMAVSLGFGVVISTAVTLVLVPCTYLLLDDLYQRGPELGEVAADARPRSPITS
jgi:multidrug efflux pump subunit AcrB